MDSHQEPDTATNDFTLEESVYELREFCEDVEDIDEYCAGGYHPVHLHERLNARYEIIHKLGSGTYATVWLAHDLDTNTNVAVKILIADYNRSSESEILAELEDGRKEHEANASAKRTLVATLLDNFTVRGVNGLHQCLVYPAARCSLFEAREWSSERLYHLSTARAIAAQLAEAVAVVHEKGIVHGDLHPGNVLLRFPSQIERWPAGKIYEAFGKPRTINIHRTDGKPLADDKPPHVIVRASTVSTCEDVTLEEPQVLLSDFGESLKPAQTTRTELRTPVMFSPPEHIIPSKTPVTFSSDIWSLACSIFVVLGQRNLFQAFSPDDNEIVAERIDALGSMPKALFDVWEHRTRYFTSDQEPINRDEDGPFDSFSKRIEYYIIRPRQEEDYGELEEDELRALEKLLRSMLAMNAEDRISAEEVLRSEWMVKWALPDLEKARRLWEKKDTMSGAQEEQEDSATKDTGEEGMGVSTAAESKTINEEFGAHAEPSKTSGESVEGPEAVSAGEEQEEKQVNLGEETSSKTQEGQSEADKNQGSCSTNYGTCKELWWPVGTEAYEADPSASGEAAGEAER